MTILRKAGNDEFDSPVERLLASLANLRQQPTGKGAHFYRTSLRRFEAWSDVFHPRINSDQQHALEFLDNLRRVTGKLRDSEVHLELLDTLRNGNRNEKQKLTKVLKQRRNNYEKKLKNLLRAPILRGIWGILRTIDEPRQGTDLAIARPVSGLHTFALDEYRAFVQRNGVITPENMHEYRLQCKRFRYTAELAGQDDEAGGLIQGWKNVQDVIGEWHDYLTLSELARRTLGDCLVYRALTAITEQKYAAAKEAAEALESTLITRTERAPKKQPRRVSIGRRLSRTA